MPLQTYLLILPLTLLFSASVDTPREADELARKAFERIAVLSEAENGLVIRAEVRVLAMQKGESKAIYARAWASERLRRTEIAAPGYEEASILSGDKSWTYQSSRPTPLRVLQLHDAMAPILSIDSMRLSATKVKISSEKVRGVKAICAESADWGSQKRCFDPASNVLVRSSEAFWETEYSDFEAFGAKMFPRTFKVFQREQLILEGKITLEKSPAPIPASQFVASPRFEQVEGLPTCSPGATKTVKSAPPESWITPTYPLAEKSRGRSGQVVLSGRIAKDGSVQDLVVVETPGAAFDTAARDAVSRWRYKPYTYCGQLVEVYTYIVVNFTMAR